MPGVEVDDLRGFQPKIQGHYLRDNVNTPTVAYNLTIYVYNAKPAYYLIPDTYYDEIDKIFESRPEKNNGFRLNDNDASEDKIIKAAVKQRMFVIGEGHTHPDQNQPLKKEDVGSHFSEKKETKDSEISHDDWTRTNLSHLPDIIAKFNTDDKVSKIGIMNIHSAGEHDLKSPADTVSEFLNDFDRKFFEDMIKTYI